MYLKQYENRKVALCTDHYNLLGMREKRQGGP
jgi:hypothetical protein